jgi:hypothetical protein
MTALLVAVAVVVGWATIAVTLPAFMARAGFDRGAWRTLGTFLGPLAILMALMCWGEHHRPEITVEHRAAERRDHPRRHAVVFVTRDDADRLADVLADLEADDVVTVAMLTPFDTPDPDMADYRAAVDAQLATTDLHPTVVVAQGRPGDAAESVRRWDHADAVRWAGRRQEHDGDPELAVAF